MAHGTELAGVLERWAAGDGERRAVSAVVAVMADVGRRISDIVSQGCLREPLGAPTGKRGATDEQKRLDVIANDVVARALKAAPVAALASEEMEEPLPLQEGAPLLVAVDPIDGSSNIEADTTIGTIFSVLSAADPAGFLQPGRQQRAAGFFVFGPFVSLAVSCGEGVDIFTLDPADGVFRLTRPKVRIPEGTREYAVNAANYRHWDEPVRHYLDLCLRGNDGPRGADYNLRWTGSPVAEFFRILTRGGVFLYPGDMREGYGQGRLRLIYEANPFAFIMEQAHGAASTGRERVLDVEPQRLHQHVPMIAGARDEVAYVVGLHNASSAGDTSPLFGRRGLFRL